MESQLRLLAMSEEQLAALIDAAQRDVGLQEKLKGAADLDAVVAIAKEAGFDVSKAALLRYQANVCLELSDEDLERVAGGLTKGEIWGIFGGLLLGGAALGFGGVGAVLTGVFIIK